MYPGGNLLPGAQLERRFDMGAAILGGGVLVKLDSAGTRAGIIIPATTTNYIAGFGPVMDQAGITAIPVYTTTQGTGSSSALKRLKVSCSPFVIIRSRVSGGAAVNVAHSATSKTLLTNGTASAGGTLVSDSANIGTVNFVGGIMFSLDGQNKGQARIIGAHSDNTSETVTVPFDYALAVNDTFLRTYSIGEQGLQLGTIFTQIDGSVAPVTNPTTAVGIVYDILIDITDQGTPLAPFVFADFLIADHVWNSID